MNRRPAYTEVRMYTDMGCGERLREGDYVVSCGPRATAAYLVTSVAESKRTPGRFRWKGLRWPRLEIPGGARVIEMTWYPRTPKRAKRINELRGSL